MRYINIYLLLIIITSHRRCPSESPEVETRAVTSTPFATGRSCVSQDSRSWRLSNKQLTSLELYTRRKQSSGCCTHSRNTMPSVVYIGSTRLEDWDMILAWPRMVSNFAPSRPELAWPANVPPAQDLTSIGVRQVISRVAIYESSTNLTRVFWLAPNSFVLGSNKEATKVQYPGNSTG